jgi:tetratricopeptide (TPR) repeat protein
LKEEDTNTIEEETFNKEDIEFLEKAFKKWTPKMLSSPYIPTPSILLKSIEDLEKIEKENAISLAQEECERSPTTEPNEFFDENEFADFEEEIKYENIIDCLHKGALAYSVGDYGTAINYFIRLLEADWLKYSSYFYLIKTLIKLDIEKEVLSLQTKPKPNEIKMKK